MLQKQIRSIHFIGICGTAMANVAAELKAMGYQISGSDENTYPPMSTFLQTQGIKPFDGYRESHLDHQPDLVVIGNAISRGNPEVEATLERKLFYLSLPELLKEFFIRNKQSIVVAGTHGKTTSAALLSWVLENVDIDCSFLIGGIPINFGRGFKLGNGQPFVLEGDEYDTAFFDKRPKFLHYLPEIAIINNIEFDHCDIYRDVAEIELCFQRLINLIPRNGLLVVNYDDPRCRKLSSKAFCRVASFGYSPAADWQIDNLQATPEGLQFTVKRNNEQLGKFALPLIGKHNAMNAVGVLIVAYHLGLSADQIQAGFSTFKNVKRRLEICGVEKGITVFDDFAHHPTAIRQTLEGLITHYPGHRIWALFEPRSNTTRRNVFQNDFAPAFEKAYGVAIGRINRAHLLEPKERLNRNQIVTSLTAQGKPAFYSDSVDEIIDWLVPQLQKGDLVVIMSNGAFDGIHTKLLAQLQKG